MFDMTCKSNTNPARNKWIRVDCKHILGQNRSTHFDTSNKWIQFRLTQSLIPLTWHNMNLTYQHKVPHNPWTRTQHEISGLGLSYTINKWIGLRLRHIVLYPYLDTTQIQPVNTNCHPYLICQDTRDSQIGFSRSIPYDSCYQTRDLCFFPYPIFCFYV